MSLAWSSVVVLLLLLPGVLFFVGLYMPEKFTRETTERSALGHVSAVVVVSLVVHALLLFITRQLPANWPRVDFAALIQAVTLDHAVKEATIPVAAMLEKYAEAIFAYLITASLLGILVGWSFGAFVAQKIGGFAQHPWVFDLRVGDNYTVAYVLTNVREGDRVLMYHGFLKWFALKKDGTFAYIVLTEATRGYMCLDKEAPRTQPIDEQRKIGGAPASISKSPRYTAGRRHRRSYFVIEGEDIANVVFDRFDIASLSIKAEDFDSLVNELKHALQIGVDSHAQTSDKVTGGRSVKTSTVAKSPSVNTTNGSRRRR